MKTSFKLFYYYFVINDVWNNIAFQIDENIIYEYLYVEYVKKKLSDPKVVYGYSNDITKKFKNNIIHENQYFRFWNLKCTFFVPNFPKI